MSQQLTFTLKYKNNQNISVCLLWYSTTPARELNSEGIFAYTESDIQVSTFDLTASILKVNNYIEEQSLSKNKCKERLDIVRQLSESNNSTSHILQEIYTLLNDISDYESDIKEWESYKESFKYLKSILEDNSDWELYYSNC